MTLHAGPAYPQGNTIVGLGDDASAINTIPIKSTIPNGLLMGKPRDMLLMPDGRMLVAIGRIHESAIFMLGLPNWQGQRAFLDLFARHGDEDPLLKHPYDMASGPDGSIYVTCQDSMVVLRYSGLNHDRPGTPLGLYPEIGPACFIPPRSSHAHGLIEPRGLAIGPDGLLHIVDRSEPSVTAWDMTDGSFVRKVASSKDGLKKPIQIIFSDDGRMFIGDRGANTVWVSKHSDNKLKHFIHKKEDRPQLPSALAIDEHWLYVGDRQTKSIQRYKLDDGTPGSPVWLPDLPDSPEFLMKNQTGTSAGKPAEESLEFPQERTQIKP